MTNGISQNITAKQQQTSKLEIDGSNYHQRRLEEDIKPEKAQPDSTVEQAMSAKDTRPKYDEFIPRNDGIEEVPGIYRLKTDEDGNQKVVFASPEAQETKNHKGNKASQVSRASQESQEAVGETSNDNESASEKPSKVRPDTKPDTYSITAHGDTSEVKAEIARLKEKQAALRQQLQSTDNDEDKRRKIEAQLAQLDAEIATKNNPEYIKRNAKKTYGPLIRENNT